MHDESESQASGKHVWWSSAGTGPLEAVQPNGKRERLVDIVEQNKTRLRDEDVVTFAGTMLLVSLFVGSHPVMHTRGAS